MVVQMFRCAVCGTPGTPGAGAEAELAEVFPAVPKEDCEVVCDSCWERLKPSRNPEQYQQWLSEQG